MAEESLSQQVNPEDTEDNSVTTFWVAVSPFFSSSLYILSYGKQLGEKDTSFMTIYDPAGNIINRVRLDYVVGGVQRVEMDMLLGNCKLENGIRHAVVVINSPAKTKFACCFEQGGNRSFIGELKPFYSDSPCFLPVTFSKKMACFIPIVNFGKKFATVKIRLYMGSKTADTEVSLTTNATCLFCPDLEFAEFFELANEDEKKICYLKITTRSDELLGVQQIDCAYVNDNIEYSSIC